MKTKFLRTSSSLTLKVCIVVNVSKVKGLVEGFVNASTFGCFFFASVWSIMFMFQARAYVLCEVRESYVYTSNLTALHFSRQSAILVKDCDMMVDASLFLWSKCKPHFQRILSSSLENCKPLLNEVFANRVRWLYRFILEFSQNTDL